MDYIIDKKLKEANTRTLIENTFRDRRIETTDADIYSILSVI